MGDASRQDGSEIITSITPKIGVGKPGWGNGQIKYPYAQGYQSGKDKNCVPVYKIK